MRKVHTVQHHTLKTTDTEESHSHGIDTFVQAFIRACGIQFRDYSLLTSPAATCDHQNNNQAQIRHETGAPACNRSPSPALHEIDTLEFILDDTLRGVALRR